jgi:hypothetical protein
VGADTAVTHTQPLPHTALSSLLTHIPPHIPLGGAGSGLCTEEDEEESLTKRLGAEHAIGARGATWYVALGWSSLRDQVWAPLLLVVLALVTLPSGESGEL